NSAVRALHFSSVRAAMNSCTPPEFWPSRARLLAVSAPMPEAPVIRYVFMAAERVPIGSDSTALAHSDAVDRSAIRRSSPRFYRDACSGEHDVLRRVNPVRKW